MLIVLEGADGSGKTTLATRIRKEIAEYLLILKSNGAPSLGHLANIIGWLGDHPPNLPIVCDRFSVISESVYGPVFREKCIHGLSIGQISTWLKARPSLVIYCRPTVAAIAMGMRQETQMEGVYMNHQKIIERYDVLMTQLEENGVPVTRYNYTESTHLILDTIRTFIRRK